MKTCTGFFILAFILLIPSPALSQERWGSDYLIGHFMEGLVVTGDGYSNFDCLYGTSSDVFVCFIEHDTGPGGDNCILRKSFNNGISWTRQSSFTGGSYPLLSPSTSLLPWNGNILVSCGVQHDPDSVWIVGFEYVYSNLILVQQSGEIDYSYPGADLIVHCFSVTNDVSGEIWIFAVDSNNWLYLTRSSDILSWTASVPVAANVSRPSAVVSDDGSVAVTWINPVTQNVMCSISDASANFQPAVVVTENPAPLAAPVPAWEHIGDKDMGIVWHDNAGKSYITISEDQGLSWGADLYIGDGIYPYINSFPGTRRMGVCYTTSSNEVKVASAVSMDAVPLVSYAVRSNHEAYLNGPSRTAFGENSSQLALFFITPTTEDFWYNNSVFTGIENSEGSSGISISADPNPTGGSFSVAATGFSGNVQYTIYNLSGRIVDQSPLVNGDFTVNGAMLPAGVYTVTAAGNGETATCRVVKF